MWVKICGIRDVDTAQQIAELRPDAIGLNFFAGTPRVVSVDVAREIVSELPPEVEPVGLFVNHAQSAIEEICERCGITTVQLHGDEPPELLRDLTGRKIIRAFRVGAEGLAAVADYLRQCAELSAMPAACLIDARAEGKYGGTGRTVSWEMLAREYEFDKWPPLVVSGGLTPGNVAEAISVSHPWGVDVASGVESSPAVKNLTLVERFIDAARGVDG